MSDLSESRVSKTSPIAGTWSTLPAVRQDVTFVFEVTALSSTIVDDVKRSLRDSLQGLVETVFVDSDVIEIIGTNVISEIESLQTPHVSVIVGKCYREQVLQYDDETAA
jgi:hypothetical protein